jgi:hypothetical protein
MSPDVLGQTNNGKTGGSKTVGWSRRFVLSAGGILLITGLAKVVSAFGKAKVLGVTDPIFGVSFGYLMLLVGTLELVVAGICLFSKRQNLSLGLTAWLATSFLAYRIGLWYVGWQRPCSCLGNLADALHIPPNVADGALKIILLYLLIGSYGNLFRVWKPRAQVNLNLKGENA